jgi:formate hydrogenlyase subunit 3/multisubunit Na+/H+ antiporter MnhD subunit
MQISIISFVLSQMLIFLSIGNISIYLKESAHKNLNGIFHKLRITIIGLVAALFNIAGLFPGVGMLEKYWLFRQIIKNNLTIEGIILCANLFLVVAIIIKTILPMVEIATKKGNQMDYDIAKDIETDFSLVMPIFIGSLFLIAAVFLKINL